MGQGPEMLVLNYSILIRNRAAVFLLKLTEGDFGPKAG